MKFSSWQKEMAAHKTDVLFRLIAAPGHSAKPWFSVACGHGLSALYNNTGEILLPLTLKNRRLRLDSFQLKHIALNHSDKHVLVTLNILIFRAHVKLYHEVPLRELLVTSSRHLASASDEDSDISLSNSCKPERDHALCIPIIASPNRARSVQTAQ